jgi:hypothetical protein
MFWDVHPGFGSLFFTHPGSSGRKGTGSATVVCVHCAKNLIQAAPAQGNVQNLTGIKRRLKDNGKKSVFTYSKKFKFYVFCPNAFKVRKKC